MKELAVRIPLWFDPVENIRPVETGYKNFGVMDLEAIDNILSDELVRCRCEGDAEC
jgi:hypothetical protein